MQVQLQSHGDTVKIGAKLILVRSVLSLKSRFIDSRNHWPGFQTCNEYSSTSNPLFSPFFIWKDPTRRNFTISSRIYSLNSFYHYTIFGFSSHSIETLGAVNVYIFRCASISWFQVVSRSVSDIFLQLAHLRVFQIFSLVKELEGQKDQTGCPPSLPMCKGAELVLCCVCFLLFHYRRKGYKFRKSWLQTPSLHCKSCLVALPLSQLGQEARTLSHSVWFCSNWSIRRAELRLDLGFHPNSIQGKILKRDHKRSLQRLQRTEMSKKYQRNILW